MDYNRQELLCNVVRDCVRLLVPVVCNVTNNVINRNQRRKGRIWVNHWIRRRNGLGASNTLLRELALEDVNLYKNHLRMLPEKFEELLTLVEEKLKKRDTMMRTAIPPRLKLEMVLRYLATGDSFMSLQYLYRVPKSTFCQFLPVVLKAIYEALKEFIQVN